MTKIFVFLLRLYRGTLSAFLGNCCRFYPSCSQYAEDALLKKGIFRGTALSVHRLLKCQPFSSGGFDPVE